MFSTTKEIVFLRQPNKYETIPEPDYHQSGELDGRDVRRVNNYGCRGELVKIKPVDSQEILGSTKASCLQDRKIFEITKFGQEAQDTVGIGSVLINRSKRVESLIRPLSNGPDVDSAPRKRIKIESSPSNKNRIVGTSCDELTDKSEDVLAGKITKRLEALKMRYQRQFDFVIDNFTTCILDCDDSTESFTVKTKGEKIGHFCNEYKSDQWRFLDNNKYGSCRGKHDFYASNIVAHQYEYLSEVNQTKKTLPKTIINVGIMNRKTNQVIHKYAGRHNSEEFKREFLTTTDNGKRTVRVANDFGLIIEGLKVNYEQFEEYAKSFSESELPKAKVGYDKFNVTLRVRPDPEVYGNPQTLGVSEETHPLFIDEVA